MAQEIFVAGPTVVFIDTTGSYVGFGQSDNDNLPSIQLTDNHHEVKTVTSGNVPAEIVLTGTSARISLALVKWDQAKLELLLAKQRGVSNEVTVGRVLVSGNFTFGIKINSVTSGMSYQFNRCYLQADGHGESQWGNRERVLTLNISAIPDADNAIYIYTPPSAP
jgi:hypothetical protein